MNQCFNCGEHTDCDDELGGRRIWVCNSNVCRKALRDEQRGIEEDVRERAYRDDFNAYR